MKPILNKIEKQASLFIEDPRVGLLLKDYYDLHGTDRISESIKSSVIPLGLGATTALMAVKGKNSPYRTTAAIISGATALGVYNALENERIILEGMGYKTNLLKTRLEDGNG